MSNKIIFTNDNHFYHYSRFAMVSKKVNMKRLKSDIWTQIDELDVRNPMGKIVEEDGKENSRNDSILSGDFK